MKGAIDEAGKAVDKAAEELRQKQAEAERLGKLALLFDNLQVHTGRWERKVYCSPLANEKCTDVFMRFNCGCCNDSPLEAWPYVKTEHGDVYSSPASFYVGERHWISGARPNARWEEQLRTARIPDAVIEKVRARFAADRRERIACAEEESNVEEDPDPFV